ncbi:hypothetical protein [Amphibacillus marinus]|uniref:hypothetical protein n=1 Tax=Amphibacillus marinus TaxID=872970 RepID=UPI00115FABCE|nr:hypothetical protein [Amphibacillus marinus]
MAASTGRQRITKRSKYSHKDNDLITAGSRTMPGARVIATKVAFWSGNVRSTVATKNKVMPITTRNHFSANASNGKC